MYLLFVTSPNPAPLRSLPFCSFSLSLFFPVHAGMYVRMFTYVCVYVWLCECEFHCLLLWVCCVLCNFHVVVFLRQLFGAPFFKTNHKHHEADDDDNFQFLFACFLLLLRFLLFLLHCNQCNLFLFCYCFLSQTFERHRLATKHCSGAPLGRFDSELSKWQRAVSARKGSLAAFFQRAYFAKVWKFTLKAG